MPQVRDVMKGKPFAPLFGERLANDSNSVLQALNEAGREIFDFWELVYCQKNMSYSFEEEWRDLAVGTDGYVEPLGFELASITLGASADSDMIERVKKEVDGRFPVCQMHVKETGEMDRVTV
jgi:hypothetical protein